MKCPSCGYTWVTCILTYSEKAIYDLAKTGVPNNVIADKIGVSEKTIKFHLTSIYKKMNVKNKYELMSVSLPGGRDDETRREKARASSAD